MIRDRQSYFNVDMHNVNTVPIQFIDAIERDLGAILAQTPAEDKLELYLKYHVKTSDRTTVNGDSTGGFDVKGFIEDVKAEFVSLNKRLDKAKIK